MRISSSDPLAARATSAAKKPRQAEAELDQWLAENRPAAVQVAVDAALEQGLAARFVLPYPPAVNRLYRVRVIGKQAFPYKTHEHRDYMKHVGEAIGTVPLWAGPLRVDVRLFRPRRVGDIDGPIKALLDGLNGRVWSDDSQVVELHVWRGDDKHAPRVEVSIHAATTQEPHHAEAREAD